MKTSNSQTPSTSEHPTTTLQTRAGHHRQMGRLWLGVSLVLGCWCWVLPSALAQGTAFIYQGRLDDSGSPAAGLYDLRFAIYDLSTGGTPQGNTLTNAATAVSNGLFTVTLDFGPGVFTGPTRWLELGVVTNGGGAFTTLVPRQEVTPTPYAMYAAGANAAGLSGPVPASALGGTYGNAVNFNNGANSFNGSFFGQFFGSSFIGGNFVGNFIGTGSGLYDVWHTGGNLGTTTANFLGTTDNQALDLRVNNSRVLRLQPAATTNSAGSLVGGHPANQIDTTSHGSVIAGGGSAESPNIISGGAHLSGIGGGYGNEVKPNASLSHIGGGGFNIIHDAADQSVIAGGNANQIREAARESFIGGGSGNQVSSNAIFGMIPGGRSNEVAGAYGLAAGYGAKAIHSGTFVWADASGTVFPSTASNQFLIRASGGVGIGTGSPESPLHVQTPGGVDASMRLTSGGSWPLVLNQSPASVFTITNGGQARLTMTHLGLVGIGVTNPVAALDVGGTVRAAAFDGSGLNLTSLNAANLTSGTLPDARMSANVSLLGPAIESAEITDGTIGAGDVNAASFNTTFWRVGGNAGTTVGTHFVGTTDNQPLEIRVNGLRGWRLEDNGDSEDDPDAIPDGAPNVIGGSPRNYVAAGVVGAVIGGGGATNYSGIGYTNWIEADFAFVGGGLANRILTGAQGGSIVGGNANIIFSNSFYSVVGGGQVNRIGDNAAFATIAGGGGNNIRDDAFSSTIGGGREHEIAANARYATIVGGYRNNIGAGASYAFAAGRQARANHQGAFVWADSTDADFSSTAADQFLIRATGGVGIGTTSPDYTLDVEDSQAVARLTTTGNANGSVLALKNSSVSQTYLGAINFETASSTPGQIGYLTASGGQMTFRVGNSERMVLASNGNLDIDGTLSQGSDRNAKQDLRPVDAQEVLARVTALPISTWAYTNSPGQRHLGPMAQDFHAAFGLGMDDKHIATVDADGVALAAIQGLNQKLEQKQKEIVELKQTVQELKDLVQAMNHQLNGGAK